MTNTELEDFANHLGLHGSDADLFYESYYDLDNKEYEQEHAEELEC